MSVLEPSLRVLYKYTQISVLAWIGIFPSRNFIARSMPEFWSDFNWRAQESTLLKFAFSKRITSALETQSVPQDTA